MERKIYWVHANKAKHSYHFWHERKFSYNMGKDDTELKILEK